MDWIIAAILPHFEDQVRSSQTSYLDPGFAKCHPSFVPGKSCQFCCFASCGRWTISAAECIDYLATSLFAQRFTPNSVGTRSQDFPLLLCPEAASNCCELFNYRSSLRIYCWPALAVFLQTHSMSWVWSTVLDGSNTARRWNFASCQLSVLSARMANWL